MERGNEFVEEGDLSGEEVEERRGEEGELVSRGVVFSHLLHECMKACEGVNVRGSEGSGEKKRERTRREVVSRRG